MTARHPADPNDPYPDPPVDLPRPAWVEPQPPSWTDGWRDEKNWRGYGPKRWWMSTHASGFTVGEVDAGRYMAADGKGNDLVDETGDYVSFRHPEEAKTYVEAVVANQSR
jgi:hypothetical protein